MSQQPFRVLKFGGSSVGRAESLGHVLETIADESSRGPLAVVVSAMGDTTDWLIDAMDLATAGDLPGAEAIVDRVGDLATANALVALRGVDSALAADTLAGVTPAVRALLDPLRQILLGVSLLRERTPQSLDTVMSFGERLSATLVSSLLAARGVRAVFVDARDWTVTDDAFGRARVDWPASQAALDALRAGWPDGAVPVCTGFLGRTPGGLTTTLGRNGSDYTATLLARGLGAQEVVVCTDVSGVMTADPRIVSDAYPVPQLSYLEALELANYGAKMFHPRTMLPLIESGIPMRIKNTTRPDDPGTRIGATRPLDDGGPTCVTSLENLALIDVRWRQLSQQARMGHRVIGALERAGVTVWMATQAAHGQAVSLAVPRAELPAARAAIDAELGAELGAGELEPVETREPVTLLSLVAERMGESSGVAGRFFHGLALVGVNVLAIAQGESSRSISCVIPAAETEVAVRTAHTSFNFSQQRVSLLVLGKGVVGGELLAQIRDQVGVLAQDHDIDLRVVGLADSGRVAFDADGLPLVDPGATLDERGQPRTDDLVLSTLDALQRLPVPVLVDCTAADGMGALYEQAFARGVHVVAANKKPLTVPGAARDRLMARARQHHRAYHYETTVGASLPVIDTLKNLVRTGDTVLSIEGAFSGTLGYLTNEVMSGVPLSQAVRTARELGYTEPRPQDDLSGLDVARKALILARELGLPLDLDDVACEPLVPADLLATPDPDAFLDALAARDAEFSAHVDALVARGEVWRYLAIIDPGGKGRAPSVKVGPVGVPSDHPAAHLRGAESFVAFTTARYTMYPLIVRGAGAGGAVTAAGVLADVLRVAQTLRGA
jgi:aspartokinase/homoserine dehydrogenase 1